MTRPPTGGSHDFARAGCHDPRRAELLWQRVEGRAGAPDLVHLLTTLAAVGDPDEALFCLDRLAEAREGLTGIDAECVLRVGGSSKALADHLVRRAPDAAGLLERGRVSPLDPDADAEGPAHVRAERLVAAVDGLETTPGMEALRTAYRDELVGIAAEDLATADPTVALEPTATALSRLAVAAIDAALRLAQANTPQADLVALSIIGMGKTGGEELNYLSDVDVIFVAEPAPGADPRVALSIAGRIASEVMRICAQPTASGNLWTVDAALRPEGKAGPLVRTLDSYAEYYQRWAHTWEFQALLKARPIAGDAELGQAWLALVTPLIWEASRRENFVEDVQAMRRRVEAHVPRGEADRQIKLGAGGLRDIEFSVQLLQLVHGRTDATLRERGTLPALRALVAGGYIARDDGAWLETAYQQLRVLEHRLQLWQLRRTHLMPTGEEHLRRLGRSVGILVDPAAEVQRRFRHTRREVRRLHERLFYRPLLASVARLSDEEVRLTPEAARDRLEALGYRDPSGALRHVEALTSGVSRAAAIQRQLLPAMLAWLAEGPDPDAGLLAFRRMHEALGSTHWYLKMLRDEGVAAQSLARVLSSSRFAVDLLLRAPDAIALLGEADSHHEALAPVPREELGRRLRQAASRYETADEAMQAARRVRARELLRVVIGDVTGALTPAQVAHGLTALTEALLDVALVIAERAIPQAPAVAVIALGRFGGGELGYGSDADVIWLHADPANGASAAEATDAATAVVREVTRLVGAAGPDGSLTVDADLRPEGRQGALIRSLAAMRAYYATWSAGWESQALLRARHVGGDAALGAEFLDLVAPLRWPVEGLPDAALREIRRLKARMEAERLPRGTQPRDHLKLGPGGLSDVEWLVQLWQLQHANAHPPLRTTGTLAALSAAQGLGLVSSDDAATLTEAWRLASRLRDAQMLWKGRASDVLPSAQTDREGVARLIGGGPGAGSSLAETWYRSARRSRGVVEREFCGTASTPGEDGPRADDGVPRRTSGGVSGDPRAPRMSG